MTNLKQPKHEKTQEEIEELLNNNPLWAFVYLMATTGRPLRDVEIIALLEPNGLTKVSPTAIWLIRRELGLPRIVKGRLALSDVRRQTQ